MKKLVLFFAVASALTFVSCSNTPKTETPEAAGTEQPAPDQTPAATDSTHNAAADSTAQK